MQKLVSCRVTLDRGTVSIGTVSNCRMMIEELLSIAEQRLRVKYHRENNEVASRKNTVFITIATGYKTVFLTNTERYVRYDTTHSSQFL